MKEKSHIMPQKMLDAGWCGVEQTPEFPARMRDAANWFGVVDLHAVEIYVGEDYKDPTTFNRIHRDGIFKNPDSTDYYLGVFILENLPEFLDEEATAATKIGFLKQL